jgi:L-galactose dehydrogenase
MGDQPADVHEDHGGSDCLMIENKPFGKTGLSLSSLGYGAAPLGNEYSAVDNAEAERSVHVAIDRGITFFDTAPYYGRTLSESRLGAALEGRRSQVVLCTKLGRYDKAEFDFSASRVHSSIDESLKRLRTDHVDLLIAHDIEFGDRELVLRETLPAMREIQKAGKARFIGISGLPLKILADVAERGQVDFVLSYCRYTLLNRDLDRWLTPVIQRYNMGLINAAPVHMGILSTSGAPPWHPAPPAVLEAGAKVVALCRERGVDPAAVAIRFAANHPVAASTLVGMPRVSEVDVNLKALDLTLDPKLLDAIEAIVAPVQGIIWPSGRPENDD